MRTEKGGKGRGEGGEGGWVGGMSGFGCFLGIWVFGYLSDDARWGDVCAFELGSLWFGTDAAYCERHEKIPQTFYQ